MQKCFCTSATPCIHTYDICSTVSRFCILQHCASQCIHTYDICNFSPQYLAPALQLGASRWHAASTNCILLWSYLFEITKYSTDISRAVVCTSHKDANKWSCHAHTILLWYIDSMLHTYYTFLIVCCILHIIMLHFSELLYQIIIMHYLLHCVWWCIPLLGAFHYLMGAGHCITWPVTLTGGLHYLMGCITGRCKALLDGLHYLVHWPVQEWGSPLPTVRRATTSTLLPGPIPTIHISCKSTIPIPITIPIPKPIPTIQKSCKITTGSLWRY